MDFDTAVKMNVYETIAKTGRVPNSSDVAQALDASTSEVETAFQRLHQKRLLVPEPGDPSRIRMAPPFSGIETPFRVKVRGQSYYGNCAWDALGVAAALQDNGIVEASDGHTGEPMTIEVHNGKPVPTPCVIHFAVPAALWWRDIVYT